MQIVNKQYTDLTVDYDLTKIAPLEDILFIDIETTGFSPISSSIYMIGCGFYESGSFRCRQFFAEKPAEEDQIVKEFMAFAESFKVLIHFNGNNFDIPYIEEKCKKYSIPSSLSSKVGIDLYRRISPYKDFIKIPNCKQKTVEQYIGLNREDEYTGGELINVYHEYVTLFDVDKLAKLLLHNENDIQGMIQIVPILAYYDLFNSEIRVTKVHLDYYVDYRGFKRTEMVMKCVLPSSLPKPLIESYRGYYFSGNGNTAILKVPVFEGELKYFYANYKDYYYLPDEDQALHKSVAGFVDKDHRQQATAATCYTKVDSKFIRIYKHIADPFFKPEYRSKEIYVELSAERRKDRAFFSDYASHILGMMAGYV